MKNFIANGDVLQFTAAAAIASGEGVVVGDVFGVATGPIANGEEGILKLGGVFEFTKPGSQAWAIGDPIYWDADNKRATSVAGTHRRIGVAAGVVGAGADATLGKVLLDGRTGPQGPVVDFAMTAAAGGANVTEVTITARDAAGNTVAQPTVFDLWLSDNADGGWLTATDASGTVQAKSNEGQIFSTYAAKKAFRAQTLAAGTFVLEITDTAKTAFKVCAQAPGNGRTIVGLTLTADDYG